MSRKKGVAVTKTRTLKCSVCEVEVERARHVMLATCFNCKEKRRKALSRTYKRQPA